MPKNILHDIMTKEQRSIREVPISGRKRRGSEPSVETEEILYEREEFEIDEREPTSFRRLLLWGAVVLFLILLGFALSTSFTGATVTVTPKTERVKVSQEFTASQETGADLSFVSVPMHEAEEVVIPADTTKKVSERASGTIVIYNTFSEKPQRLIKNTRFETPEGLIYRIGSSVTVPGKTAKGGRVVPGNTEARVTGDAPGTEYNIPLSDFTIPGFKNDASRFSGFYARSKTPMTGGFEGTVKVPADLAVESARAPLREALEKKITKKRETLVPVGYILFDGAVQVVLAPLPIQERGKDTAAVKEVATGAVYLFKKDDIAKAIVESAVHSFSNLPVEIPDLAALTFQFTKAPASDPAQTKNLRFTLKGEVNVVWRYDEATLKTALAGRPKTDLASTLSAFPMIEKADAVLRPFWSRHFPENPKKITIKRSPDAGPTETVKK